MAKGPFLKRPVSVAGERGEHNLIRTVPEALAWIEAHRGDRACLTRTRRALTDAAAEGSLRRIRSATRAFEEAVARLDNEPASLSDA